MRSFIAAALIGAVSATIISEAEHKFMRYIADHNKSYGTREEYNFRLVQFARAEKEIMELNKTETTSTHGHNHMSDWSVNEYKQLLGYRSDFRTTTPDVKVFPKANAETVNWVTKGAVTPVKNQGSCGSCWSFSTTGSMEGANQIETGKLISLSEQQFVSCDKKGGDHGCAGGLMDNAFKYAESNFIETEADYPYKGLAGIMSGCKAKKDLGVVGVKSFYDVTPSSPDQLKAALDKQPVSVAIEANKSVFQRYTGGVITSDKCGTKLDHGVLAVGYGTDENGVAYYLVKNSWGPSWGLDGYVKIGIVQGLGICGIQTSPSAPTTDTPSQRKKGLPPAVKGVPIFIAGMLDNLVEENKLTEIEACYNGGKPVEQDIATAIAAAKGGDIPGAIADLQKVLTDAPAALQTCKSMGDDIKTIEDWAKQFTSIQQVVEIATEHYILHKKAIDADISTVESGWKSQDYFNAGKAAGDAVNLALGPIKKAKKQPKFNISNFF